jgi:N-acetylglucosamine repressor
VDFEARTIRATSVDFAQRVLRRARRTISSSDAAGRVVRLIEQAIVEVTKGGGPALLGIGVGVPGTIDPKRGVALHYEYIKGWRNVPLVERLAERFGIPVYLENNIRSMALAERWFGQGRGVDDFICLGVRSGIGAGIVMGGRLHRGHDNLAGEIGAWPWPEPQRAGRGGKRSPPNDGALRTLEEVGSVRALLEDLSQSVRGRGANTTNDRRCRLTWDDVLAGLDRGEPNVHAAVDRLATTHGWVIAQLALTFNPEKVILAGPLTELGDSFLRPLRNTADRLLPPLHARVPEIVGSELGDFVGTLGAAALAVHQWRPVR